MPNPAHTDLCRPVPESTLPIVRPEQRSENQIRPDRRADHDQQDRQARDQLLPVLLEELPGHARPRDFRRVEMAGLDPADRLRDRRGVLNRCFSAGRAARRHSGGGSAVGPDGEWSAAWPGRETCRCSLLRELIGLVDTRLIFDGGASISLDPPSGRSGPSSAGPRFAQASASLGLSTANSRALLIASRSGRSALDPVPTRRVFARRSSGRRRRGPALDRRSPPSRPGGS